MDRGEPSLKPEWLVRGAGTVSATNPRPATSSRADHQGRGASSRNRSSGLDREQSSQQSSSQRGSGSNESRRHDGDGIGKSRGYASFGRSNSDRGREKVSDFRTRETKLGLPDDPLRDGFESFSSCRPERHRLNRTRSKLETWNRSVGVSLDNGNLSRKDAGGISFEREFPHLGSEDKNGKQDIGRVPSPGISTPIQSIPLVTVPDVWNSVLAEVPVPSEPSNNTTSSSLSRDGSSKQLEVPVCGTTLSMAETVMQAPLRISTAPQLSIDAQKIEERTIRQCILRPLTPSSSKISVSSSSDKLKAKGSRAGDSNGPIKVASQLSIQPSSSSVRTQVKTELVKPSQSGSFQVLSREQNGITSTTKDSNSNPVSPVLGRSSSVEPLKKPIVNQKLKGVTNGLPLHLLQGSFGERKASAKDKHKFFELLRSKSLNSSGTSIESSSSLVDEQQNSCLDLSLFNSGIKCIENGSSSCEEANSCGGSQQHLSDNEEMKPPLEPPDVFDEGSQGILADNSDANSCGSSFCEEANSCGGSQQHLSDNEEMKPPLEPPDVFDEGSQGILADNSDANSSSDLADTEYVVSKEPQTDNAEATPSTIPADINDSSTRSDSGDDEANLLFDPIGAGEEAPYLAQEKPSPEEMAFLLSLGWNEHEVVPPLQQEEIADCLRRNERLQQKVQECRG